MHKVCEGEFEICQLSVVSWPCDFRTATVFLFDITPCTCRITAFILLSVLLLKQKAFLNIFFHYLAPSDVSTKGFLKYIFSLLSSVRCQHEIQNLNQFLEMHFFSGGEAHSSDTILKQLPELAFTCQASKERQTNTQQMLLLYIIMRSCG